MHWGLVLSATRACHSKRSLLSLLQEQFSSPDCHLARSAIPIDIETCTISHIKKKKLKKPLLLAFPPLVYFTQQNS